MSSITERRPAIRSLSPRLRRQAVGERLRDLRLASGASLRRLADRTGFSPSFVSQVENGLVSPSIASMERLAAALGLTLGEFFAPPRARVASPRGKQPPRGAGVRPVRLGGGEAARSR